LVPMALPLAMLISSVMVLGNLAEHYELSSLKSAGISLLRVMAPMIIFGAMCTALSYYCSDYLIPVSNLKFGSRMYDIQRQKPALRLEEGVFNDDFQGFAIRIGDKKGDGQGIGNVIIYDHKSSDEGAYSHINARSGRMFTTPDQKRFVMKLHDGHQYVEPRPSGRGTASSPFIRTNFKTWTRAFDLSEFDLQRTNEELFKSNRSMLSIAQLQESVDSMAVQIEERRESVFKQLSAYISLPKKDTASVQPEEEDLVPAYTPAEQDTFEPQLFADTGMQAGIKKINPGAIKQARPADTTVNNTSTGFSNPVQIPDQLVQTFRGSLQGPVPSGPGEVGLMQNIDKPLASYGSFVETFDTTHQNRLIQTGTTLARSLLNQAESTATTLARMKKNRVKFIYELHTKYSFAAMCIVFLFIGAPMGAIVRKGGFGFPILISTIFFVLFIILTIFCRKIAEAFVTPAQVAAWIPCMIFIPIGTYLTLKAMNDSEIFRFERLNALIRRLIPKKAAV
jgi:lipopolysaccharide export system permease protein